MSNDNRWSKFWWQDWRSDTGLRMCSLAARGLWMELLCLAHNGSPIGHVTIGGRAPSVAEIAKICGEKSRNIEKLLLELEKSGVFSRTENGTIFCRRMVRDAQRSAVGAAEVVKKWGDGELSGKTRAERLAEARKRGTHTQEEWEAMLTVSGNDCLRCGNPSHNNGGGFVKDHIIPIYQGGSDSIENIQPMCRSCNAAKGRDTTDHRPEDWRKRLGECLGKRLGHRLGQCLGGDPSKRLLEAKKLESEEREGSKRERVRAPGRAGARPPAPLPDDWLPSAVMIAFGLSLGLTEGAVGLAADRMRDWSTGSGKRMADWDATFRNWLRGDAERAGRNAAGRGGTDPIGTLRREWQLPSFLNPILDDDEPPVRILQ